MNALTSKRNSVVRLSRAHEILIVNRETDRKSLGWHTLARAPIRERERRRRLRDN